MYVNYYENLFIISLIIGITVIVFFYGNTYVQTTREGWYSNCNTCRQDYISLSSLNNYYTSNEIRDRDYTLTNTMNRDYILKTTYNTLNDPITKIKSQIDEINKIKFSTNATTSSPVPITPKITVFPTISVNKSNNATIAFDEIYLYFDTAPTCVTTPKKFTLEGKIGQNPSNTLVIDTTMPLCGLADGPNKLDIGQYKITM